MEDRKFENTKLSKSNWKPVPPSNMQHSRKYESPGDQCLNQHNKDYLLIGDHIPIGPIPLDGLKVTNKVINIQNIAN